MRSDTRLLPGRFDLTLVNQGANANERDGRMPRSLWAAITPAFEPCPSLQGNRHVDIGIIGGGLVGISSASALAQLGHSVAILEAAQIGWGASGRNHGLVTAGLKRDPWELHTLIGNERAERLIAFSGDAASRLFRLINELDIQCDARQCGWIQPAHSAAAVKVIRRRYESWGQRGADVEWIERADLANRLGCNTYLAAWRDGRGGSVNPLALTRGLAQHARESGVEVFCHSKVFEVRRRRSGWELMTANGSLNCDRVIYCTNAYGELPAVRGLVLPLRTAQVASAVLSSEHQSQIVAGNESVSDTQRLLTSFRKTADGRLIMGGADATAGAEITRLQRSLHRAARERFNLPIQWEYFWSGKLALTRNHLPLIYEHGQNAWSVIACNGRGLAMATAMGPVIAKLVADGDRDACPVPVCAPRRHPGHRFARPGVAVAVRANRLLDRYGCPVARPGSRGATDRSSA